MCCLSSLIKAFRLVCKFILTGICVCTPGQCGARKDCRGFTLTGLDCSLLGAIGLHYAHLQLRSGLGLGLGLVLGLGVGLGLVFSET